MGVAQVNNDCHRCCWPGWCRWKRCYCWLKTEALKEEEENACFETVREKEDYECICEGKNLKHRGIRGNSNYSTIVKIGREIEYMKSVVQMKRMLSLKLGINGLILNVVNLMLEVKELFWSKLDEVVESEPR